MKESYSEEPATHAGPESCVATREGRGEALTGVRIGRVSSLEIAKRARRQALRERTSIIDWTSTAILSPQHCDTEPAQSPSFPPLPGSGGDFPDFVCRSVSALGNSTIGNSFDDPLTGMGYDTHVTANHFLNPWAPGSTLKTGLVMMSRGGSVDGLTSARRDTVWQDLLEPSSSTFVSWPDVGPPPNLNAFSFNTHPEWTGLPFRAKLDAGATATSHLTCEDEYAAAAWRNFIALREFSNCLSWEPELFSVDTSPGTPQTRWWIAVPCHSLTRSPELATSLSTSNRPLFSKVIGVPSNNPIGSGAGCTTYLYQPPGNPPPTPYLAIDVDGSIINSSMRSSAWAVDAVDQVLVDRFTHGLVQLWDITNPTSAALAAKYPFGNTKAPLRIVLPDPKSTAWKVRQVRLFRGAIEQHLLFVADFGGRVYVYDLDGLRDDLNPSVAAALATPGGAWPKKWSAPARLSENLPVTNVRAMDVERRVNGGSTPDSVDVYVGAPEFGIYVLSFEWDATAMDWRFDPADEAFIETPGDVHDLKVRPADAATSLPRTLLVSDGPAGIRLSGAAQ